MKREYKLTINSKSIDLDKVTEAIRQITGGTVDIIPVNVPKSTSNKTFDSVYTIIKELSDRGSYLTDIESVELFYSLSINTKPEVANSYKFVSNLPIDRIREFVKSSENLTLLNDADLYFEFFDEVTLIHYEIHREFMQGKLKEINDIKIVSPCYTLLKKLDKSFTSSELNRVFCITYGLCKEEVLKLNERLSNFSPAKAKLQNLINGFEAHNKY